MARIPRCYTPDDLKKLKRKLPHILTLSQDKTTEVLKQFPDEIDQLISAFDVASECSPEWLKPVLGQILPDDWQLQANGMYYLKPSAGTSLRYLSTEPIPDNHEEALRQVKARRALIEALYDHMPIHLREQYAAMVQWVYFEILENSRSDYPLMQDAAIGEGILYIENLHSVLVADLEAKYRQENPMIDTSVASPFSVTIEISAHAKQKVQEVLQTLVDQEINPKIQDSLFARVIANLAANKALLEIAALEARAMEAADCTYAFLTALNECGITEVPDEIDDREEYDINGNIKSILISWFGFGGKCQSSHPYFKRHLTHADADVVIAWINELQEDYIEQRGSGDGKINGHLAHGSHSNKFIFAMAMMAGFYSKSKIAGEFVGENKYAVFPDRKLKNRKSYIRTHAAFFVKYAYGQIFYSNKSWELRPDNIHEYAKVSAAKRSHLQELIFLFFKHRPSNELHAVHKVLTNTLTNIKVRKKEKQETYS